MRRALSRSRERRLNLIICSVLSVDVLDNLFTVLYENDVVGEEVFLKWEERGREDLVGQGVATMSVKSFMTWLKSADAENEDGQ